MNKIPCTLIRDLLPGFIENLLEEESKEIVKEHLQECENCRKLYENMKSPEEEVKEKDVKEVDFLKKVKKRNLKKTVLFSLTALLIPVVLMLAFVFIIGTPVKYENVAIDLNKDDTCLLMNVYNLNSALKFRNLNTERNEGTVILNAREVLSSPFIGGAVLRNIEIPLKDTDEVIFAGEVIYKDGLIIDSFTKKLYGVKTPYMGSMPDLEKIINLLPMPKKHCSYELLSKERPYMLKINYNEPLSENDKEKLKISSTVLMALTENLDGLVWEYTDKEGNPVLEEFKLEDAEKDLPLNIKDCYKSVELLQELLNIIY